MFEGPAFSGKTLKTLFDLDFSKNLGETESSFVTYAAARVCSALEDAARQKIDLYNIGAGGIFISSDYQKIIFLPRELFKICVDCAGSELSAEYNGFFINPQLKKDAAINYTQAVIAYRILTGEYPFPQIDSAKRSWDITDKNYIPLKNKIWALDEKLSFFVDNALQRKSTILSYGKKKGEKKRSLQEKISSTIKEDFKIQDENILNKFRLSFPLEELYRETGLTEKGEIPGGGQVFPVIRKSTISPDQFEKKCAKENRLFKIRLERKRWIRKNRTQITVTICAIFAVAIGVLIFVQGNLKNPTSKSLTSFETVEMYYSALNTLNAPSLQGCSSSKGGSKFLNMISNVFVAAKTKASYNAKDATVSPAEWFCFNYDFNYNIFGLSEFFIDGTDASTFKKGPAKKTNPKSITSEYGSSLIEGASKDYTVRYALVHTENEDDLCILNATDEVHLLFYHGRWIVTALISHELSTEKLSFKKFKEDFKDAWNKTNQNPKATAAILRKTYDWIPTDYEIEGGQKATDSERNPFSLED